MGHSWSNNASNCWTALLYSSALPDFATMRDNSKGTTKNCKTISKGIRWKYCSMDTLRMRIGMMSTFYFFTLIFVHFLNLSRSSMSMIPGWRDAIYPMAHAMGGIQGGIASVIILAWIVRKYCGYENYITFKSILGSW